MGLVVDVENLPVESYSRTLLCTHHLGYGANVRTSACSNLYKGIFRIMSASKSKKYLSNRSPFHTLFSWSINRVTLVSCSACNHGEITWGWCLIGSQYSPQTHVVFPSPILQATPLWFTSLSLIIFFHAFEEEDVIVASIIEQLRKNSALKTW